VNKIKELFSKENIPLNDEQLKQFVTYRELILEYNKKFNLTAITDNDEIAVKHFLDSALGYKYLKDNWQGVDIGSGAGFPAIPIKITNQTLNLTLLDALQKRVNFLQTVCDKLNLQNVECLHKRAEEHAKDNLERYDFALARAVSGLATLLEYALPLLKVGGIFIAYKGDKVEEEISNAKNALKILGGEIVSVDKFLLDGQQKRSFIVVKKIKKTPPIYPRGQNKPKNNPL